MSDQLQLVSVPRGSTLKGCVRCGCGSYEVKVRQDPYRGWVRCTCDDCGSDVSYRVGDRFGDDTVVHAPSRPLDDVGEST